MNLFGSKKKNKASENVDAYVKVLGSGCTKCQSLETAAKAALATLKMDTTIAHITDFAEIAKFGVMSTPALVLGDKVVSTGKVLTKEEVMAILEKEA